MSGLARRRLLGPLVLVVAAAGPSGCGGVSRATPPRPELSATRRAPRTTTTTNMLAVERQIRAVYLRSWDAYSRAVWTFDTANLERWFADAELATVYREVDERVRDRRRSRVHVTHDVTITVLSNERAIVADRLLNESVAVNADTGRDLELAPHDVQIWQFTLERKAGVWKVVYSARSS